MARRATVEVLNYEETRRRIIQIIERVTSLKERQQILAAGAMVVRNYSKNVIMKNVKSKRVVPYYQQRRGRVASILPGNLKQSMYVFKQKDGNVSVGPRVLRTINNGSILGAKPRSSSGYYAHMIYGGATQFRQYVTDAASTATYSKILQRMERKYNSILKKWQRRYNL